MKLSDFGLCKPLDCSNLPALQVSEPGHDSMREGVDSTGRYRPAASPTPKRTQQEQLLHWQKNRRMLVLPFSLPLSIIVLGSLCLVVLATLSSTTALPLE